MLETFNIAEPCNGLMIILQFDEFGTPMLSSHYHKEVELLIVTKGRISYRANEQKITVLQGGIIFFPSMLEHQSFELDPNTEVIVFVYKEKFRPLKNKKIQQLLLSKKSNRVVTCHLDEQRLSNILDSAYRICPINEKKPTGFEMIQFAGASYGFENLPYHHKNPNLFNAGLEYIFELVWEVAGDTVESLPNKKIHPSVLKACDYLSNSDVEIPLTELAQIAGLSEHRLSRVFKKQLGVSITVFRNQLKIDHFFRLYYAREDEQISITELAYEAGFGSYSQFHKVFKAIMGCKPSAINPN